MLNNGETSARGGNGEEKAAVAINSGPESGVVRNTERFINVPTLFGPYYMCQWRDLDGAKPSGA